MLLLTYAPWILSGAVATITVDVSHRTPISPYIYGANHPDWDSLKTPFPIVRQGGNRLTAYNWETNASNAGSDWHHQNDDFMGKSNEPGMAVRTFFQPAQTNGAVAILTVPTAGYVAADKAPAGDVNQTPNYLTKRFLKSLPKKPGGKFAYPPDTKDRFVYQDEFVAWVERTRSTQAPIWYSLDNEPDIWASTHARIVTKARGYADIVKNNTDFAMGIKSAAPNALIFGPASYGWNGFRTFQNAPDANGRDFVDFYLQSMKAAQATAGKRLLDVLDLHWYPEAKGDGVRICFGEDKPGTPAARIQAPRSLWDPTYVEDSWIADSLGKKPIRLLPDTFARIAKNYPGTRLALTEYDFGGGQHVSGLVAEADALGIFGREGLFAACHWGIAPDRPATLAGFRAFLNYDGRGSKFGDQALRVGGTDAASESVYAAANSSNGRRLTLIVINKTDRARPFRIQIPGFAASLVRGWRAQANRPFQPSSVDASLASGTITYNAAPLSVTTLEISR